MSSSPFASALGAVELPQVFRDQLFTADVVLEGEMDAIWHRPWWIGPVLRVLARGDVLFPEVGERIPASLHVEATGEGYAWRRSFFFPQERRIDAVLIFDERAGLFERVGRLDFGWSIRFEPPDRIDIDSTRVTLRVGRARFRLPRLLAPRATAVEVARGPDRLAMSLVISHPLLGPFFGYSGTFTLRVV